MFYFWKEFQMVYIDYFTIACYLHVIIWHRVRNEKTFYYLRLALVLHYEAVFHEIWLAILYLEQLYYAYAVKIRMIIIIEP